MTATTWTPFSNAHRNTRRPIRPKPLIPILTSDVAMFIWWIRKRKMSKRCNNNQYVRTDETELILSKKKVATPLFWSVRFIFFYFSKLTHTKKNVFLSTVWVCSFHDILIGITVPRSCLISINSLSKIRFSVSNRLI